MTCQCQVAYGSFNGPNLKCACIELSLRISELIALIFVTPSFVPSLLRALVRLPCWLHKVVVRLSLTDLNMSLQAGFDVKVQMAVSWFQFDSVVKQCWTRTCVCLVLWGQNAKFTTVKSQKKKKTMKVLLRMYLQSLKIMSLSNQNLVLIA